MIIISSLSVLIRQWLDHDGVSYVPASLCACACASHALPIHYSVGYQLGNSAY